MTKAQLVAGVAIVAVLGSAEARTFKPGSLKARWPIKTSLASGAAVSFADAGERLGCEDPWHGTWSAGVATADRSPTPPIPSS